ncbi:glycoside hydrolase family 88 protein [Flammeovirga aprica]|uniref:Glucuronyl hydrolase n=1 Tax=Flammeovirga aprica JL-4 TaxID=694437 RepID=A0A7X9RS96_9BACT|nr:glycoside hydrolase family 88 protein [Flammeovirga aprica]NME66766.1 glucuronyl hydrolase [Flammeovirga aprica JL-4]
MIYKTILEKALGTLLLAGAISCQPQEQKELPVDLHDKVISVASVQLSLSDSLTPKKLFPRSLHKDGSVDYVKPRDWTSGFFPGSLWFMYELTGDKLWKEKAEQRLKELEEIQYAKNTHDIGFMMYCSYGTAYRLTQKEDYKEILLKSAESLMSRFVPETGTIRSWDWHKDPSQNRGLDWEHPVIIDNMMNLELLYWATQETGDQKYADVANQHALTTMEHHFRRNYSTYHVVDYNPENGDIRDKGTFQGFSDTSEWARGQAWGLYGYTLCYRFTKDNRFLEQAKNIAKYYMNHPILTEDLVPYWDFHAPNIPNAERDASAAAIVASALYELSTYVENDLSDSYITFAEKSLASLSSDTYLAQEGENGYFLLKHCTGNWPNRREVDAPLNYGDYYLLEALQRSKNLKSGTKNLSSLF